MIIEVLEITLVLAIVLALFIEFWVRKKFSRVIKVKDTDMNVGFSQVPQLCSPLLEILRAFKGFSNLRTRSFDKLMDKPHRDFLALPDHIRQLGLLQNFALGFHIVTIFNPDIARELLFSKDTTFVKFEFGEISNKFISNSILNVKGERWKKHKKILGPAFHWDHIKDLVPEINTVARILVQKLEAEANKEIAIYPWMHRATMDMIGVAGFGHQFNSLEGEEKESQELKNYQTLMVQLQRPIFLIPRLAKLTGAKKKLDDSLDDFTNWMLALIAEKREMLQNNSEMAASDILELLVRAHDSKDPDGSLSDVELIHNMNTFFIAGHETTAGALGLTIHQLADHPIFQELCHEELQKVCGERDPTQEDFKNLVALNNCLFEAMRLYPPAPAIVRIADHDAELGGFKIPKGVMCAVNFYSIHRNPSLWDDPDSFNPNRFLPGESKHHPGTFLPFSMGPRQCIGNRFAMMEMKIVLAHLIKSFVIESVREAPFEATLGTVTMPKATSRIVLRPRNQ